MAIPRKSKQALAITKLRAELSRTVDALQSMSGALLTLTRNQKRVAGIVKRLKVRRDKLKTKLAKAMKG